MLKPKDKRRILKMGTTDSSASRFASTLQSVKMPEEQQSSESWRYQSQLSHINSHMELVADEGG